MRAPAFDAKAHRPADHELGELALGAVRRRPAADDAPAADDGDAVGDLEDLVELVADEDHARALGPKTAQHLEDLARLLGRQHRGRLIQHEDPRVAVDGLQDLDTLLLADGELVDPR